MARSARGSPAAPPASQGSETTWTRGVAHVSHVASRATEGPAGWREGRKGGQTATGPCLDHVARRDVAWRGYQVSRGPLARGRRLRALSLGLQPTSHIPQEVGAKSGGYAQPPMTPSAAAGPAPSPVVASSEELVSLGPGSVHVPHVTCCHLLPSTPLPGGAQCPSPNRSRRGWGLWVQPAGGVWEELPEAEGRHRAWPCTQSSLQTVLSLLQTVPRAHQDTSPLVTTRPANPGPSECPRTLGGSGGLAAWEPGARSRSRKLLAWGAPGPVPHNGPSPCSALAQPRPTGLPTGLQWGAEPPGPGPGPGLGPWSVRGLSAATAGRLSFRASRWGRGLW